MGWTDSHLWEFRIKGIGFGIPDPDLGFGDGPLDACKLARRWTRKPRAKKK